MPKPQSNADSLVRRAISASSRATSSDRQDLPSLDLVGAAIARAARLAAAEHRARRAYALVQRSQAAELLRSARDAAHAARQPVDSSPRTPVAAPPDWDESRVIPHASTAPGFIWRFHPAPPEAGAPIAPEANGALP